MSVCKASTLNTITCHYQRCGKDAGKTDVYCTRHRLMLVGTFTVPIALTTDDKLRELHRRLQKGE